MPPPGRGIDALNPLNRPSCLHRSTRPSCLHRSTRPSCLHRSTRPSCLHRSTRPSCLHHSTRPSCLHCSSRLETLRAGRRRATIANSLDPMRRRALSREPSERCASPAMADPRRGCHEIGRQLFAALRAVDSFESQVGADLIVRALDHIHVVRSIFQAHLQGVSHGYESTGRAVFHSLVELDRESETIDRWYVDIIARWPHRPRASTL